VKLPHEGSQQLGRDSVSNSIIHRAEVVNLCAHKVARNEQAYKLIGKICKTGRLRPLFDVFLMMLAVFAFISEALSTFQILLIPAKKKSLTKFNERKHFYQLTPFSPRAFCSVQYYQKRGSMYIFIYSLVTSKEVKTVLMLMGESNVLAS